ncbi:Uncharacterised protein [Agrobacterium tumefaciens]|nr:Uncharacterised protein [Agrobacterium tumefaciens]
MGSAAAFLPARAFLDKTAFQQVASHHAHGRRCDVAIFRKFDPRCRALAPDVTQKCALCRADTRKSAVSFLSQSSALPALVPEMS